MPLNNYCHSCLLFQSRVPTSKHFENPGAQWSSQLSSIECLGKCLAIIFIAILTMTRWWSFINNILYTSAGGDNPKKHLSPGNLEYPPDFLTYLNANFAQYPALFLFIYFFCSVPELHHTSKKNCTLPIPGKIFRFLEEFCFSP